MNKICLKNTIYILAFLNTYVTYSMNIDKEKIINNTVLSPEKQSDLNCTLNRIPWNSDSEDIKIERMKAVLDQGANVNYRTTFGTALTLATEGGLAKVVKFLLEQPNINPNITLKHAHNKQNALMLAIQNKNLNIDIIKLLIDCTDINTLDSQKNNILNLATDLNKKSYDIEALVDIITKKAKEKIPDEYYDFINNANFNGYTPLINAIRYPSAKLAEKLLAAGADPNTPNKNILGYEPLANAYNLAQSLASKPIHPRECLFDGPSQLKEINKLMNNHKQKLKQEIQESKIFGECNEPGLINIIADY